MLFFYKILTVLLAVEFILYSVKYFKEGSLTRTLYTIILIFILNSLTFLSSTNPVLGFPAYTSFAIIVAISFCTLIFNYLLLSGNLMVDISEVFKLKFVYLVFYTIALGLFFYFNPTVKSEPICKCPYKDINQALHTYSATFHKFSLLFLPLVQFFTSVLTLFFSLKYSAIKKQPWLIYLIIFTISFGEIFLFLIPPELRKNKHLLCITNIPTMFLLGLITVYLPYLDYQPSSNKLFIKNSIKLWKKSKNNPTDTLKILQLIQIYSKRERISRIELFWYKISILKNWNQVKELTQQLNSKTK